MIESDFGRTDGPEVGHRGSEARPLAKAEDGDVREPVTALALVDGEPLEPLPDGFCKQSAASAVVLQDDHADASGLPVATRREYERTGTGRRVAQRRRDGLDIGHGASPEKGEGDVEVLSRNDADARTFRQVVALPRNEPVKRLVRQWQSDEETQAFTAADASSAHHAGSSLDRVNSCRTRWSAIAVARLRTASRSPGRRPFQAIPP
jgi:hypothetical protein